MSETDETQFAFGANKTDGCHCPAVAAGMNPVDNKNRVDVVKEYDHIMWKKTDEGVGKVSSEEARSTWNKAIRVMKEQGNEGAAEYGKEIADELDW